MSRCRKCAMFFLLLRRDCFAKDFPTLSRYNGSYWFYTTCWKNYRYSANKREYQPCGKLRRTDAASW